MRSLSLLLLALALGACDLVGGGPEIVRYTGPEITQADATAPNEPLGPASWGGLTVGDEVLLDRRTLCGDECSQSVELRFEGRGALPSHVEGTVRLEAFFPERIETHELDIARVEIQDWGPEIYSGVVYTSGVAYPGVRPDVVHSPIVFWADDLPAAAY